ncbi:uncharacterized protein L969DRAFT_95544 [Mixia osmundae IAM 14324]|uniref:DASH complex subunit DUO1 n=1 Tax=Mixia osmundae (strain CBS 9802 / IAM 14324 / JCM 22182 / KY 12970) TaxID=764103 RepID=G7E7Q5_MIXOS|nr:uncharacterized protein L969DRAFT_95544 [Mixia osmundae IAM 14324]KEI38465.1 hypothetical protein L969DRAFT_95544 [Mixia osmundae IAM 14324]GAA98865.1 hypothetical protein E5Q_05553 [Mixia osmundae IAM 14324]
MDEGPVRDTARAMQDLGLGHSTSRQRSASRGRVATEAPAGHTRTTSKQINGTSSRDEALVKERDQLAKMNDLLEETIAGLETSKHHIARLESTIGTTDSLLSLYTGLLSQTEHAKNLILDQDWQGTSTDIATIRAQEEAKERERQEALRLATEEEAQKRARAEQEHKRTAPASSRGPSTRGRGISTTATRSRGQVGMSRGRGTAASASASSDTITATARNDAGVARGRGTIQVTGVRAQRGLRSRARPRGTASQVL